MNLEIRTEQNRCNNQSDWLSQADNLNDSEAAQVNGGASVESSIQALEEALRKAVEAQARITAIKTQTGMTRNAFQAGQVGGY